MTRQNTAKAAQPAADLRQRAARARDAAGRFIRRSVDAEISREPSPSDLAQACDQAIVDWNAIQPRSRAEDWGDEQLGEALDTYGAVFRRAIDEPSCDVADVQAKARLLLHDLIANTTGHDPSDETTLTVDDRLTRVVLREVVDLPSACADAEAGPVTVEEIASLDFAAYTFDTPTRDPNGWMEAFSHHAMGMHIADRTLRMGKPELTAFIQAGGERDDSVPVAMLNALDTAQETFEGWGKLLSLARSRFMIAASSAALGYGGTATEAAESEVQPEAPRADEKPADFSLVSMLDLTSASLTDLQSLHDIANLVGGVAYAMVWTGRCKARGSGDEYNPAGKLMQWLGDALSDVESAANNEARGRAPLSRTDRETGLEMLALPVIQNGDPNDLEAFARELLDHAAAKRRGH